MTLDLCFGLFVGQVNRTWDEQLERVLLAEDLGFDHAWLVDHFVDTDGDLGKPCLEAWTLLAALAARTQRIRLGVLVSSNTFRHPALLLKEAVTVDHVSAGRLTLGVGSGWHEPEHRMYGLPFPAAGERVDRLEEAVQVMAALMTRERTTFVGRHYHLRDAPFVPKPVQRPRIPLLIAAHRPRMIRLAARYADIWDTFPSLPQNATEGVADDVAERVRVFDGACRAVGRVPGDVRRSTWASSSVLTSPEAFLAWVEQHRTLGFTDFTAGLPATESHDGVRRIAAEVLPGLRAGGSD